MTISGHELAREAGITYRQLDYWVRAGVLEPVARRALQSGVLRVFDDDEARVARALAQLRTLGAPLKVLREVAGQLREFTDSDWRHAIFVDHAGIVGRFPSRLCWALDLSDVAA